MKTQNDNNDKLNESLTKLNAEEFLNGCRDKGAEALAILERLIDAFEDDTEDIDDVLDDTYSLLGRVPAYKRK